MNNPYYTECPVKDVLSVKSLYTFFRKQIPRDYNFKGESHDFHEILCVMSGEVGVTADKNVYRLPRRRRRSYWKACAWQPSAKAKKRKLPPW